MNTTDDHGWEEVREAAEGMRYVWRDPSELDWAKEAWGHLHAAGLTSGETLLQVTAAQVRLVALARIYHEFYDLAWDEDREISLSDLAVKLAIEPVALGLLVPGGNSAQFDSASNKYEMEEAALDAVTESQRAEIFKCLKAAYGGSVQLYTRMWHARPCDAFGELDENDCEGDEFEVNKPNSVALSYIMKGFFEA